MVVTVKDKCKKSLSKKGRKVILSPFVVGALKRLAKKSSKNSMKQAMAFYEYLHPNASDRRRFV